MINKVHNYKYKY